MWNHSLSKSDFRHPAKPMSQSLPASRSGRQKSARERYPSTAAGPLAAIEKLTDAWMRKDLRGMSRQLSDDITELGPAFPKPLVGKHTFFEKYQAYFSGSLEIESYHIMSPRLVELTPQLVLAHFRYRMTTRNQGSIGKSSGQESMLVEHRRGRWRVRFIHWHKAQLDGVGIRGRHRG